jgi:uncharacterized HAD superfamily protein
MSEEKKVAAEVKLSLSEEKNLGFLQSMSKTNIEKITKEILEGLSESFHRLRLLGSHAHLLDRAPSSPRPPPP